MSRNIRQHLADLSGKSVCDFNYSKLASHFDRDVKAREAYDYQNEIEQDLVTSLSEPHVNLLRRALQEAIEKESAEMNGNLPVISLFEAAQTARNASTKDSRDFGLNKLAIHLERMWKRDKSAHLNASDLIFLKDHYNKNFPKSAASNLVDEFTKSGFFDLPVGDLIDIANQIRTQADFDYYIKEAGLHTNNPRSKKARHFILALLNGKTAQMDDEALAQQYEERADAARQAGWSIEIDDMMPTIAITAPDGETEWFFQEHEADRLLEEVPEWVNAEDYILAQSMEW